MTELVFQVEKQSVSLETGDGMKVLSLGAVQQFMSVLSCLQWTGSKGPHGN